MGNTVRLHSMKLFEHASATSLRGVCAQARTTADSRRLRLSCRPPVALRPTSKGKPLPWLSQCCGAAPIPRGIRSFPCCCCCCPRRSCRRPHCRRPPEANPTEPLPGPTARPVLAQRHSARAAKGEAVSGEVAAVITFVSQKKESQRPCSSAFNVAVAKAGPCGKASCEPSQANV